jgi:hypothetical protein
MSFWIEKLNIYIVDIDELFTRTNTTVAQYLENTGLPLSFDFSNKFNKDIYTHYFLNIITEMLRTETCSSKLVFYNNTITKDVFRNKLIQKLRRIFGFKIWDGVWESYVFQSMVRTNDIKIIDQFELFVQKETKPKTFKHIKKYLEKEGLKAMSDTYFRDVVSKMTVCC